MTSQKNKVEWFDGHNDSLLKLSRLVPAQAVHNFEDDTCGELNLPSAQRGGFVGGIFAIFCPSDPTEKEGYYSPLDAKEALPLALEQIAIFQRLSLAGQITKCLEPSDLHDALQNGQTAAILHLEGAEALGENAELLDAFYKLGMRSLGPVWSRSNTFGTGVPMIANSTPDLGPGLTEVGKALVRRCDDLGIMVDLSHINEKGFWDVAQISKNPLVATHSNAHALCPHARNLTDQQLQVIAESKGVVGLTFAVDYTRPDGKRITDTPLQYFADHFDYLLARLGSDSLAIGSDFDGAYVPDALDKADQVPDLLDCLKERGHDSDLLQKVFRDNWIRAFTTVRQRAISGRH